MSQAELVSDQFMAGIIPEQPGADLYVQTEQGRNRSFNPVAVVAVATAAGLLVAGCKYQSEGGSRPDPTARTTIDRVDGDWRIELDVNGLPRKAKGGADFQIDEILASDKPDLVWKGEVEVDNGDGAYNVDVPGWALRDGDYYSIRTTVGITLKSGKFMDLTPMDTMFRAVRAGDGVQDETSEDDQNGQEEALRQSRLFLREHRH